MFHVSPEKQHLQDLKEAKTWDDWYVAARSLDQQKETRSWILNPIDKHYDWQHVRESRGILEHYRHAANYIQLGATLRHSLVRHIYNITNLSLYKKTYAVPKEEIHLYVQETIASIKAVTRSRTALQSQGGRFTAQDKRILIHDLQKTYGKTALVLQGGSVFGICHLGAVRALDEQGILPTVIVGTATGALMAALVGSKTKEELPDFVCGDSLDLSALAERSNEAEKRISRYGTFPAFLWPLNRLCNWLQVIIRRMRRLTESGLVLDPNALARCVEDNVGDMTFEEAYKKTGRILNIIISPPDDDVPSLMNYLTAPRYLIRSAAMASHASDMGQNKLLALRLLRKEINGEVRERRIELPDGERRAKRPHASTQRNEQFRRLRQQFNVEHYIISQARPYIAPFTRPSLPYVRGRRQNRGWLRPIIGSVIRQTLGVLDHFNLLPPKIHRVLSDETFESGNHITLVPEISLTDWPLLLQNPKKDNVHKWLLKGERAVWPSLCALNVRMSVEMTLHKCWQELHNSSASRRHATDTAGGSNNATSHPRSQVGASGQEQNQAAEDRLLRDMQRGVGGFVPGITGMDHITTAQSSVLQDETYHRARSSGSQDEIYHDAEGENDERRTKIPRLVLSSDETDQDTVEK